jgi:hypothetical protein
MYKTVCIFLLGYVVWAQTSRPLEAYLESYIVTTITKAEGTLEEQFSQASTARPGQIVEYRIMVVNSHRKTREGHAAITGPVPAWADYLAETATPTSAKATLEFSADNGLTFADKPMLVKKNDLGEGKLVEARPEEYTTARWMLRTNLAARETLTFSYRVMVK